MGGDYPAETSFNQGCQSLEARRAGFAKEPRKNAKGYCKGLGFRRQGLR